MNSFMPSPTFKFLIGPEKREYVLHSTLVAKQSSKLNMLINGPMKEAEEKCVTWSDTNEGTFIRFCEFVYKGSYSEGKVTKRPIEKDIELELDEADDNAVPPAPSSDPPSGPLPDLPPTPRELHRVLPTVVGDSKEHLDHKGDRLRAKLGSLYPRMRPKRRMLRNTPEDDCSEMFLSHAQIYVFADYHCIDALQELALANLRQALTEYKVHKESCSDVTQLLSFSFESTAEADKKTRTDQLRCLVSLFAACNIEHLWNDAEFQDFTRENRDFSCCLIEAMLERLD
ncbi:hypothetical protein QQS21_000550 [Conoideocrella luteorostrata]|uniref:BTB domain-containing protein n=1 Tax=Conoideocrella luteorostrata TaxID=1105319 RepID=A0AAJ0G2G8_9HYPO|nr:hypothetical protein QQS21_000550 [Conoideocrella luteorostrata]